jgi:hypothetical protein
MEAVDTTAAGMRGVNRYWQEFPYDPESGGHRQVIGGLWDEIGRLQFEFLTGAGLRPHHRLLDIGCGCLRGGVHFVRYLDPGHYSGLDVNRSLLAAGEEELRAAGLADRGARLIADDAFRFGRFGTVFDFGIAVSVFTHLYTNHVARCLVEMRRVMHRESRFYVTYFEAPRAYHLEPITHQPGGFRTYFDADPFHHARAELTVLAGPLGLAVEFIGDWGHPRAQRMACFRLE